MGPFLGIDGSPLYGNSDEENSKLRAGISGKMKASFGQDGFEYLPVDENGNVVVPDARSLQNVVSITFNLKIK